MLVLPFIRSICSFIYWNLFFVCLFACWCRLWLCSLSTIPYMCSDQSLRHSGIKDKALHAKIMITWLLLTSPRTRSLRLVVWGGEVRRARSLSPSYPSSPPRRELVRRLAILSQAFAVNGVNYHVGFLSLWKILQIFINIIYKYLWILIEGRSKVDTDVLKYSGHSGDILVKGKTNIKFLQQDRHTNIHFIYSRISMIANC